MRYYKYLFSLFDLYFLISHIICEIKSEYSDSLFLSNEKVCQTIDIRRQAHLSQLDNCTVVEGDLFIVLVTLPLEHRFPLLKEITGSLVLYFVKANKSLEAFFPNLVIIRGQSLVYNYALVIKETNLLYIPLVNLRLIMFGGIRIDNNPLMCYTFSIDWKYIVRQPDAPLKIVNMRNICPDFCPKNCSQNINSSKKFPEHCWSHKMCQNVCSKECINRSLDCFMDNPNRCCHPECLGGCYGDGDNKCVSCRNVMFQGRCIKKCENSYYKYKNRRCINQEECWKLSSDSLVDYRRKDLYAIEKDSCVKRCSPGKRRNDTSGHCESCGDNCPKKYCGKILVHSIKDLTEVDGCYSIEEIYISIKEGGTLLSDRLIEAFSKLTVIENSIKIVRSSSITSLNFLKSLRLIKGNSAKSSNITSDNINRPIVFEIYFNENLVEITNQKDLAKQLNITILHGSVSFNLNRKLCPEKIISFLNFNVQTEEKLSDREEKNINISNGDKAFCKHEKLNVTVKAINDSSFTLEGKQIRDPLLLDSISASFLLKEADKNITSYDLFDSCSEQKWRRVEAILGKPITIGELKPARTYAVYVEAILSKKEGLLGISDIIYLTTKRKRPTPPINLKAEALSAHEIKLTWGPPLFPNGVISKYFIWYRNFKISEEFLLFDFCHERYSQKHRTRSEIKPNLVNNNEMNSAHGCDCSNYMMTCKQNNDKKHIAVDYVYIIDVYLSEFFKKQRQIPESNWIPKSPYVDLKHGITNESYSNDEQKAFNIASENRSEKRYILSSLLNQSWQMVQLPADVNFFTFTNLHHYTEYLFEIQACQDPFDEIVQTYESNYSNENSTYFMRTLCSTISSVGAYTFYNDSMDDIDEDSISTFVNGTSVIIYWSEPSAPNGLILKYLLKYKDLTNNKSDNPYETECITRLEWLNDKNVFNGTDSVYSNLSSINKHLSNQRQFGSFILRNLRPSDYEFIIQPVSIPIYGRWTKPRFFTIPQDSSLKFYLLLFIVGTIVFVLILASVIYPVYYYHRKKYLRKTKWVSSNPDYWIIYEIDEWEIERKDVDMMDWNFPLGRGSFGMVYKGILKNLSTPTRFEYRDGSNLKDLFVAVKTLNTNSTILERREFINEACYMKQFQSYHLVKLFGIVSKVSHSQKNNRYGKKFFNFKIPSLERIRHLLNQNFSKSCSFLKNASLEDPNITNKQLDDRFANSNSFKSAISQHFKKMPLVIMELMEYGDLANYLRTQGEEGEGIISEEQSHLWALQIADGMLYLSEMKFVHRDLAARNCMINSMLIIKIGDFGMARDVYYDCYYRKEGKVRLPVRWMAPESLQSALFTTSSDVWSYGVVLWEISTLASLPYRGKSHHDVIQFVTNGGSLITNSSFKSSKVLLNVMKKCWQYNIDDRFSFQEILQELESYADQNFYVNSYYFQQKFFKFQNQETCLSDAHLDTDYSIKGFVHDS